MASSFIISKNGTPPIFTSSGRINDCGISIQWNNTSNQKQQEHITQQVCTAVLCEIKTPDTRECKQGENYSVDVEFIASVAMKR